MRSARSPAHDDPEPEPEPSGPLTTVDLVAEQVPAPAGPPPDLSEEDYRILWEQFTDVYSHSQQEYDSSIRPLASAGIGVVVAIGTALHTFNGWAAVSVGAFLASVGFNLLSYGTAQLDMRCRQGALLRTRRYESALRSRWTRYTTILNLLAGAAFVVGGVFVAVFVAKAT